MVDYVDVNKLEGIDLIYYFLNALSVQAEWVELGGALKICGHGDFFVKKPKIITDLSELCTLNHLLIIERYGIEISIFTGEDGLKLYKCKRFNGRRVFVSKSLIEGIMRTVVDWRYDKAIPFLGDKGLLGEKYEIPLESLGLSFNLIFSLKKAKLDNIKAICRLNVDELLLIVKNEKLMDELTSKLRKIAINID